MPRLNTLIEVGFCSGYGDGDFRVSMAVADMPKKQYDELRLAVLGALNCADDLRRNHGSEADIAKVAVPATDRGDE